jgi:hypothetical protein
MKDNGYELHDFDEFTLGYLEAMLQLNDEEVDDATVFNINPLSVKAIVDTCKAFQHENADTLRELQRNDPYHDENWAGAMFCIDSNGYGDGFMERSLFKSAITYRGFNVFIQDGWVELEAE